MRVPPSSPFLSNTAYISRMMHTPTVPRFQPAILILDVSHDIGISDIPLDPPSKGDFPPGIPPSRGAGGVGFSK